MTRRLYTIGAAIVLAVILFLVGRSCWDTRKIGTRAVATEKVDEWKPQYDSVVRLLALKDSAYLREKARALELAHRPPVVVTRTIQSGGEAWVPRTDFDAAAGRIDSLRTTVVALTDTIDAYRRIPPRIIAAADTVIKYQKILVDTPKPRRRWGLGVYGGYGATKTGADVKAGPQIGVGLSYSF